MFQSLHRLLQATPRRRGCRNGRRPRLETLETRCLLSLIGSEQLVNPTGGVFTHENSEADNASSANGTSVAVWVNNYSGSDNDIYAQRFDNRASEAPHPRGVSRSPLVSSGSASTDRSDSGSGLPG